MLVAHSQCWKSGRNADSVGFLGCAPFPICRLRAGVGRTEPLLVLTGKGMRALQRSPSQESHFPSWPACSLFPSSLKEGI